MLVLSGCYVQAGSLLAALGRDVVRVSVAFVAARASTPTTSLHTQLNSLPAVMAAEGLAVDAAAGGNAPICAGGGVSEITLS